MSMICYVKSHYLSPIHVTHKVNSSSLSLSVVPSSRVILASQVAPSDGVVVLTTLALPAETRKTNNLPLLQSISLQLHGHLSTSLDPSTAAWFGKPAHPHLGCRILDCPTSSWFGHFLGCPLKEGTNLWLEQTLASSSNWLQKLEN